MKKTTNWLAILTIISILGCNQSSDQTMTSNPEPPIAKQRAHQLVAHGQTRTDHYYWMRDDQRQDSEVLDYLNAENAYTEAVLSPHTELQETLYQELIERIPADDSSIPYRYHGFWLARQYREGHDLPFHVRWPDSDNPPDGKPEILLDEGQLKADSEFFEVGDFDISMDGQLLAWTEDRISRGIYTLKFRALDTQHIYPDIIEKVSDDVAIANDSQHVFYLKLQDKTLIPWQVWRHKIGSPSEQDVLVYQEDDASYHASLNRTIDDRYIAIELASTTTTETLLIDANNPTEPPIRVLPRSSGHEYSIESLDQWLYILSNEGARNFKLVRTSHNTAADRSSWQTIVAESKVGLLSGFAAFAQHIVVSEITEANQRLTVMQPDGSQPWAIESDSPAYEMSIDVNTLANTSKLRYTEDTPVEPTRWYEIDMHTREKTLLKQQFAGTGFNSGDYIVKRIEVKSRDNQLIPVTLIHRKDLDISRPQPLYQLGYGSYGISYLPGFFRNMYSLIDRGFIFALAHIRGGQEKGRGWYEDGKLLNKKNTFNDFVDVTRHLQAVKLTTPALTVASGRSAGGLLMGAVINQAPENYQVIIAGVPFVDVITTMLDETIPLTTFEYDEWGDPNQQDYYAYMLSYSPYDQVTAQDYPHMYVGTGLWDPAVQYWEPAKWVAKLRQLKTDDNQLVMFTDMNAGHRGGAGRYERQKDTAREMAFILTRLSP